MCVSSLVPSRRPQILKKKTSQNPQQSPRPYRLMPGFTYAPLCYFLINGCPSCTKPHFFKKCAPLLHETFFREMCAPLVRNHTFCEKCVPPLHQTLLFCKNTEIRTRGYVNNSRNLPTSRTKRTQGRNIPFEGTPHSDVRNVELRYFGEVFVDVSRCIIHVLKYTSLVIPKI